MSAKLRHTCNLCEACEAVYAALLAVAKAMPATTHDLDTGSLYCTVCEYEEHHGHRPGCALAALDADYPVWREWGS